MLLSAGELIGRAGFQFAQSDQAQDFFDFGPNIVGFHFFYLQSVGDVFKNVQMGKQGVALKHHRRVAAVWSQRVDPFITDQDIA